MILVTKCSSVDAWKFAANITLRDEFQARDIRPHMSSALSAPNRPPPSHCHQLLSRENIKRDNDLEVVEQSTVIHVTVIHNMSFMSFSLTENESWQHRISISQSHKWAESFIEVIYPTFPVSLNAFYQVLLYSIKSYTDRHKFYPNERIVFKIHFLNLFSCSIFCIFQYRCWSLLVQMAAAHRKRWARCQQIVHKATALH